MANLSARFTELQAELVRLRQDPHEDDEADRLFRRIAVRAAMCYRKCALAKLDGFEPAFFLKLPDNPEQAEGVWVMAWECIVNLMVSRFSDELEPTPVHPFGDVVIEPVSDENGVRVSIATAPPERWRQRFEDHARVLGLLAEIAVPLTGKALKAAERIKHHPGEAGDAIARAIKVTPGTFRRNFGKLRLRGFYNDGGYWPPVPAGV